MKKVITLVLCLALAFAFVAPTFAATKADIMSYLKAEMPARYQEVYIPWAENILAQYDLTEAQCDRILEILRTLRADFPRDEGYSLHQYVSDKQVEVLDAVEEFCTLTGSTYQLKPAAAAHHVGDVAFYLYKADGTQVAVLDPDADEEVRRTGEFTEPNTMLLIGAVALITLAGAVVLAKKKVQADA